MNRALAIVLVVIPAVAHAQDAPREDATEAEASEKREDAKDAETAQTIQTAIPQWLLFGAGYAIVLADPDDDSNAVATGVYAGAEYVFVMNNWVSLRPYAGFLFTVPDRESCSSAVVRCDVSAKIAFAGGKARFTVPIPYVSPFIELGVGASAGAIASRDARRNASFVGVTEHLPVGLGLSIGGRTKVDLDLQYLIHFDQRDAAVFLGFSFGWRVR